MRLGDLDDLKKRFIQWSCSGCAFRTSENPTEICCEDCYAKDIEKDVIDNAQTFDVTKNQAYDQGFITAMRLYSRPQGELANDVWKLYEKYQSHLATRVIEFGDELKELLDKYQKGGAV